MTGSRARGAWLTTAILPVIVGAFCCSPSAGSIGTNVNGTSSGSSGAGSGSGGDNSLGGGGVASNNSSGGDGFIGNGTGSSGSTSQAGNDGGCTRTTRKAEQVQVPVTTTVTTSSPVDMYILYDQSGSMNDSTPKGTKWDAIKAALTGFVNDPSSAGIGVGIGFFPSSPPACTTSGPNCFCLLSFCIPLGGGSCTASDYATPSVPIDLLPNVAPQIIAAVNAHGPGGGTPTAPALAGAIQYASGWAAAHTDRKTIVVLATDGDPTGCTANSVQDVANEAAAAYNGTPSLETFVIGVGSSLTSLNSIAAAGGSGQALIVDATSGDPTQQFLDAMNKIRQTVTTTETHTETQYAPVPCTYDIPPPPDGLVFDKTKVNVEFSTLTTASQPIGAVNTEADCGSVANGWHYDDPSNPKQVLVCSQTCTMLQAAAGATVDIVFGCDTVPAIIQ